mmetsp:Transcript_4568/g.10616  ORF Transcript_4568/g.10616 Transcript_4568/m.10616 type:complete len:85 (-) Transcript_4568:369-623(-)
MQKVKHTHTQTDRQTDRHANVQTSRRHDWVHPNLTSPHLISSHLISPHTYTEANQTGVSKTLWHAMQALKASIHPSINQSGCDK